MKLLIAPLGKPPAWLIVLAGILWIIYRAIYKDLNPDNLQIQDAIVQIVLILMSLIGVAKSIVAHVEARFSAIETGGTTLHPAVQRDPYDRRG